jgi:hypothetical protein
MGYYNLYFTIIPFAKITLKIRKYIIAHHFICYGLHIIDVFIISKYVKNRLVVKANKFFNFYLIFIHN